jgi:hypothetical protein
MMSLRSRAGLVHSGLILMTMHDLCHEYRQRLPVFWTIAPIFRAAGTWLCPNEMKFRNVDGRLRRNR